MDFCKETYSSKLVLKDVVSGPLKADEAPLLFVSNIKSLQRVRKSNGLSETNLDFNACFQSRSSEATERSWAPLNINRLPPN